jgi:molybdenum cofactor synthesis domain-containing protein
MSTGEIKAICMSEKKGTSKRPVEEALFITEHGLKGDAHAGDWHRQVSFLALEEIEDFRRRGGEVEFGDFGENIVAEGIAFDQLPVGTRLKAGEVFFEITQIGKQCHSHCEIFKRVGDCIMPRKGVFGRVLHGGRLKAGDTLTITEEKLPLEAAVITASDKGAKGEREDKSGDKAEAMLKEAGYTQIHRALLPDEKDELAAKMREFADMGIALILTTGGTGFSPRDVTPEATLAVCERLAPGIPEAMRALSLKITPRAMLSRAAAGIHKRSLIVNLPGSPKAVEECLGFILPSLAHGIEILRGETGECARK